MEIAAVIRANQQAALHILLLLAISPIQAGEQKLGEVIYGTAVPVGAPTDAAMSHLSFEMERCGPVFRTVWRDAGDTLVAADELEDANDTLTRYRFTRPNVAEWAQVTRDGNDLRIEHGDRGRVRTGILPVSRATLVGPMMALIAERRLGELSAGALLQFSYAVPERLAAYDFTLTESAASRGQQREVTITANSWIVRQFANQVTLYFGADGQFAGMHGRGLPVSGEPGRAQPLELDVQVLKREARQCSPVPHADGWFRLGAVALR